VFLGMVMENSALERNSGMMKLGTVVEMKTEFKESCFWSLVCYLSAIK